MAIYVIKTLSNVEDYIKIDADFSEIRDFCTKSEIQFLDKTKIEVTLSDDSGTEFSDILLHDDVFLFSDRLIRKIKSDIEDYVFLKACAINATVLGKSELYWIVVAPKIDCLDLDKSEIIYDWDFNLGIIPILHCNRAYIDENLIGRFKMFKIAGVDDDNIYITQDLLEKINELDIEGAKFILVN